MPIQRRPKRDFVVAADVALEIHAPDLLIARPVTQGTKRNAHLGRPANVRNRGDDIPGTVPVQVESATAEYSTGTFADHLPVVFDAGRIGAKKKAVLPVQQAIQDDLETVRIVEAGVAPAIRNDDAVRIVIVGNQADVQGIVAETHEDFRFLRRRMPFVGLPLPETAGGFRTAPGCIAQHVAVEDRCLCQRMSTHHGRRLRRRLRSTYPCNAHQHCVRAYLSQPSATNGPVQLFPQST